MKKPNILMIVADDMGYGDFGLFSEGRTSTPAIDSLSREGICLTQHYAAAPVCTPARAALLTGRYHHRTGAIDMRELRGLSRLSLRETTIADVFQSNGYVTGLIGKWHSGTIGVRYHPNARGFDEFVGFRGGCLDYYDWCLYYDDVLRRTDGRYLTDVFMDEAISFIQRHQNQSFFLNVAFNAPHTPLQAPEEDVRPFLETGRYNRGVSILYGMIAHLDRAVGQILHELDRLGLADNTLVLFTSDNGPQFGGQGELCTDRFNTCFSGSKGNVYEGGIRVPAVVRWPEHLEPGLMKNDFVHATDWFPTLLAAARIDVPASLSLDGQNILPVLKGERDQVNPRRFWQWNRYTPVVSCNAAMRDGPWKLVQPPIKEAMRVLPEDYAVDRLVEQYPENYPDIVPGIMPERTLIPLPPQLFNIAIDPSESEDLSAIYPERTRKMLTELETWFNEVEAERNKITE